MHYVQESLSPGEKILKISHYHWVYVMGAVISALIFFFVAVAIIFLGIIYHYYDITKLPPWNIPAAASELAMSDYARAFWHTNILVRVAAFIMILMGILSIGARMLVRSTTEMAVTTKRVILKRGLVSRRVDQMRTDFIEGDDLDQSIMGRLFNYGQVKIYGTGTESIFFPPYTTDPIGFRRALQAARNMSVQQQVAMAANAAAQPNLDPNSTTLQPR